MESLDWPTAVPLTCSILGLFATVISLIWKYAPVRAQRHIVETQEGERCATREQMEKVSADLMSAFKEHSVYVHTRFHDQSQLSQTTNNRLWMILHKLRITLSDGDE